MRVLNLYAGLGGNRKLWQDVDVTAVENNEQIANVYKDQHPNDTVIIGDAHEYLLNHFKEFDFIWSSPPCQSHSKMNKFTRHDTIRYFDASLYQQIILLQQFFTGKWVVENVVPYYKPLIPGKQVGRHIFWANFNIRAVEIKTPENFINHATKKVMMDWLDIHYEKNIYYGKNHCPVQILRNCVHPKLGLQIFNCSQGLDFVQSKLLFA